MNNKAQIQSIGAFIGIVIVLILLAPVILKVGTEILSKSATQFSQIDATNKSADVVTFTQGKLTGTIDWIVMTLVLINILLMMVTAFLIDVHPAFVVIYIIGAVALVISAPFVIMTAEKMYSMGDFSSVISYIPMTEFLMNNFAVVIVGVIVLTGIIMFAKIKLFNSGGGTPSNY